jgi:hypothetical protein
VIRDARLPCACFLPGFRTGSRANEAGVYSVSLYQSRDLAWLVLFGKRVVA